MTVKLRKPPERANPQEIVIDLTPWLVAMLITFMIAIIAIIILVARRYV